MNYKKIYDNLCSSRKVRDTVRESGFEVHHIVPRCLGGLDDKQNLVKFTYREHLLAHKLLIKIYPESVKMVQAYGLMLGNLSRGEAKYKKDRVLLSERLTVETDIDLYNRYGDGVVLASLKNQKFHKDKHSVDINFIKHLINLSGKPCTNRRIIDFSKILRFVKFCFDTRINFIKLKPLYKNLTFMSCLNSLCELSVLSSINTTSFLLNYETVHELSSDFEIVSDFYRRPEHNTNCSRLYFLAKNGLYMHQSFNSKLYCIRPIFITKASFDTFGDVLYKMKSLKEVNQTVDELRKKILTTKP